MSELAWRELERHEERVLGALRCVDATSGAPIEHALQVSGDQASLMRKAAGLYVIRHWRPLAVHQNAFSAPPVAPAVASQNLVLDISDPSGRYLPRRVSVALPRDANPLNKAQPDSLFNPLRVPMYASGIAPIAANWAGLRLTIAASNNGDALGGALVRIISNGQVLARGLSDWRGEALVPVAGVPVTTWSEDPGVVIVSSIAASVEVRFDATSGTRSSASSVAQGRPPASLPRVDPAALEANGALPVVTLNVQLAAGQSQSFSLSLSLP